MTGTVALNTGKRYIRLPWKEVHPVTTERGTSGSRGERAQAVPNQETDNGERNESL